MKINSALRLAGLLSAIVMFGGAAAPSQAAPGSPVYVPDSELQACINSALWRDSGATITEGDLASLEELNCSFDSVRRLDGLEYAVNLKVLDLAFNDMWDLQLPQLPRLEDLDVSYNNLTTINLTSVPNVRRLNIKSNAFTRMTVQDHSQIVEIDASFNSSLSTAALRNLPKLETLDLSDNGLGTVDMVGVPGLKTLDLRDNEYQVYANGLTTRTDVLVVDEYSTPTSTSVSGSCTDPDPVRCSQLGDHVVTVNYGYYSTRFTFGVTVVGQQFSDVPPGSSFYNEINWMAGSGISAGYSDGTYRPGLDVHRAAMAAFIYRAVGRPAFTAPARSPFVDVRPGDAFYKEITWMASAGISAGYADGTFRPGDSVSRGAMAAFMYRAAGRPAFSGTSSFSDVGPDAAFRREIDWMATAGISAGYPDGTFRSDASVHRGAMAAFMYRFV